MYISDVFAVPDGGGNDIFNSSGIPLTWDGTTLEGATQTEWYYSKDGLSAAFIGNWYYESVGSTDEVAFDFSIPLEFVSLVSCDVMIIPDATETVQWDIDVSVSADGEAHDNDTRSADDQTQAVTSGQLTPLDVSGQLTGLTTGDSVSIRFQSDTITLRIIAVRFRFK